MNMIDAREAEVATRILELAKSLHKSGVSADEAIETLRQQFESGKKASGAEPENEDWNGAQLKKGNE